MSKMKIKIILWLIVLIIAVSTAYAPSLRNDFTNLDDDKYIVNNNMIRDLSLKGIKSILSFNKTRDYYESDFARSIYIPLSIITFAVEYHFFQLIPCIYHYTNLMLHVLNTLLVFWMIWMFSKNFAVSVITSILFGIHPLHVESVAWISERKDVLYALFFLFSIISYMYYLRKNNILFYILSLAFFLLSMLSKPMAVTLPLVLMLVDLSRSFSFVRKNLFNKAPFLLIAVIYIIITITGISLAGGIKTGIDDDAGFLRPYMLISIFSYGMLFYVIKFIMPLKLSCFYPYSYSYQNAIPLHFLYSPLIFSFIYAFIFYISRYSRKISAGFLFFLITILPVAVHLPPQIVAERFVYIPLIGIFYIVGESFSFLYETKKKVFVKYIAVISIVLISLICFVITYKRCFVWKNSETLWSDVIRNSPCFSTAYNSRATYYLSKGEKEKAFRDLNKAIEIDGKNVMAFNNRGLYYLENGELNAAISDFTSALEYDEKSLRALIYRGNAFNALKKYQSALKDFDRAVMINPYIPEAYINRANIYLQTTEYEKAVNDFSKALELRKDILIALINRGTSYREMRKTNLALRDYQRAIEVKIDYIEIYINRGVLYMQEKLYDKAVNDFTKALSINRTHLASLRYRAIVFYKLNRYEDSIKDMMEIERAGFRLDSELLEIEKNIRKSKSK